MSRRQQNLLYLNEKSIIFHVQIGIQSERVGNLRKFDFFFCIFTSKKSHLSELEEESKSIFDPLGRPTDLTNGDHFVHMCCPPVSSSPVFKIFQSKAIFNCVDNICYWHDCGFGRVDHQWLLSFSLHFHFVCLPASFGAAGGSRGGVGTDVVEVLHVELKSVFMHSVLTGGHFHHKNFAVFSSQMLKYVYN